MISIKFKIIPKKLRTVRKALKLYRNILAKVNIPAGNDIENYELARNLTLAQFCMICYHNLRGSYNLALGGEQYIPHALARGTIDHFITWAYIDKDPKNRVDQFITSTLRKQRLLTEKLMGPLESKLVSKERLKERLDELNADIKSSEDEYGKWERNLEQRAQDVGLQNAYDTAFRFLSGGVHPDAMQSEHFFSDFEANSITVHEFTDSKERWQKAILTSLRITNELMVELDKTCNLDSFSHKI